MHEERSGLASKAGASALDVGHTADARTPRLHVREPRPPRCGRGAHTIRGRLRRIERVLGSALLLSGVAVQALPTSSARAQPSADQPSADQPSADQPSADHDSVVTEADLVGPLSPNLLVQYAAEHNPAIRAARFAWEATRERITVESWYENPMLTYTPDTGSMPQTRAGPQANGVKVSQAIPFPGKLTTRGRVEEARADATYQVLEATTQEISRQIRARYAEFYLAARSLVINDEITDLTRQFSDIAQAKYQVGTAALQDVILAQEKLSRLATDDVEYRGDFETAIGALNALLDRPPRAPLGPPGEPDVKPLTISLARLIEAADEYRPELLSQDHTIEASRQSLRLAWLEYLPDLKLEGEWVEVEGGTNPTFSGDGDDIWMVKLGFSVPLWLNRIGAETSEMEARLQREKSFRRNLRNQVLDQVQRQYERVLVAVRTEEIYRRTLMPQTAERVAAARAGYQTGEVDFLTLIDSLKSLEEVWLQRDGAVRDYEQGVAGLERAVGQPLSDLVP
ncbi:MAG: TolC family protein [Myxococcota bacterium]|nr:TolC family protein [Myxococcota bacterium]